MKKPIEFLAVLLITFLASCNNNSGDEAGITATKKDGPDVIYFGGDIITMEEDSAVYAEAIGVKDGKITFIGSRADAEKLKGDSTIVNNLQGKTLLPGFIDPHSHFINSLSMTGQANCFAPPAGNCADVNDIIASLQEVQARYKIPKGEMIIGYGYDEKQVHKGRQLNRDDLDKAFPGNPVVVGHISLQGAVLNSLALKQFGFSAKTITPRGGVIIRKPGTNEPYGLIMGTAFFPVVANIPKPTPEQLVQFLKDGQMIFAAAGITTAQEGNTHSADLAILERGARENVLFIDVMACPFVLDLPDILKKHLFTDFGKYNNHLKLEGVKISLDGSPQERTTFFTKPYLLEGAANEKSRKGGPVFTQDSLNAWTKKLYENKIQLIVHANSDAAIDRLLKAHEYACKALNEPFDADRRTTIIHSQFVRKDRLEKYKAYNMIPSFYTENTFFFANTHIENHSMAQASFISPVNTATKMGITCTNYTDFNVLPLDQMMLVWTAVNRTTRTGVLLGADERITPYLALKCITINAAKQYFEEGRKGSLKIGKIADLVILQQNPLRVDPLRIKDIKVSETIKEGKTIYKR